MVAYEEKSSWTPNPNSGHGRSREWSLKGAFHYKVFMSQFKRGFTKMVVTELVACKTRVTARRASTVFVSELTCPSYSYPALQAFKKGRLRELGRQTSRREEGGGERLRASHCFRHPAY